MNSRVLRLVSLPALVLGLALTAGPSPATAQPAPGAAATSRAGAGDAGAGDAGAVDAGSGVAGAGGAGVRDAGAVVARPATPAGRRFYFGAISIASDGAAGWTYDRRTRQRALSISLRKCRSQSSYPGTCRRAVWVRNGCAAVSVRYDRDGFVSRYRYGIGPSRAVAERRARKGFGGKILVWVCTTR